MNIANTPKVRWPLIIAVTLMAGGCASISMDPPVQSTTEIPAKEPSFPGLRSTAPDANPSSWSDALANRKANEEAEVAEAVKVFPGSGQFVRHLPPKSNPPTTPGDITLNFENTDMREVVKVILGDLLEESYILGPGVRGAVTMQTTKPLHQDALLPTLETLLRMNGSGLVKIDGVYRVLSLGKITKGTLVPQLGDAITAIPAGYSIRIIPLQYISADEMTKILQPLINDGSIIRTDTKRNLLLLAGTGRELQYVMDTIRTFDVDWIAGMSVGFFELEFAKVEDVLRDLETILSSEDGGLGSLLRITPIDSLNGLLVVTPRPHYLKKVSEWIKRLDKIGIGEEAEPQLYVYRVRNGDAEKLAGLLSELFAKDPKAKTSKAAEVAPGQVAKTISSNDKKTKDAKKTASKQANVKISSGDNASLESELRIVADSDHNALLILSTPRDYQKVLRVLERLDVVPLQVHIEATIVEVVLSDELKYGIQWFFDSQHGSKYSSGTSWGSGSTPSLSFPGFNWSLVNSASEVRAVLTALAGKSLVNVLSAPSVMVLDNHTAKIQIGDQVPISTQQQTNVGNNNNTVTNSIQYRDTGIVLTVKPRVNPGGLVTMEVEQEVSSVSSTSSSNIDSPTIATRKISSTVAVQSGQSVVLGGLIQESKTDSEAGVPLLYRLPFIGKFFGETVQNVKRTELVIILTPRVIANNDDARRITEDFRARLQGLKGRF